MLVAISIKSPTKTRATSIKSPTNSINQSKFVNLDHFSQIDLEFKLNFKLLKLFAVKVPFIVRFCLPMSLKTKKHGRRVSSGWAYQTQVYQD